MRSCSEERDKAECSVRFFFWALAKAVGVRCCIEGGMSVFSNTAVIAVGFIADLIGDQQS